MSRHPDPSSLYRPITATPFRRSAAYRELPPCPALKPYIRCFWGTEEPSRPSASQSLVIPDTCMDVIFTIDEARGIVRAGFCAMDENAHSAVCTATGAPLSTFAIRFYAWTASTFTERPLTGSKNRAYDAADFFPTLCRTIAHRLAGVATLRERAAIAEDFLLAQLNPGRLCPDLMNAVDGIITSRGTMRIADLAAGSAISRKRLERVFDEHMGLSPKSFSSLARYQLLWQEMCLGRGGNVLDLVEKYGYFDQAHLLNDFKKRHSMTPAQALCLARG